MRRLQGVTSRIAYSLLNIPSRVVAATLGTREIYFSREHDFKAVFRGHRLPVVANNVWIRVTESVMF